MIALMAGIVGAAHLSISPLAVQASLLVTFGFLWVSHRYAQPRLFSAGLLCAFALTGFLLLHVHLLLPSDGIPITAYFGSEKRSGEGVIAETPQASAERTELILKQVRILDGNSYHPVSGRLMLQVQGSVPFSRGDRIRFQARLREPRNFGNPGAFDYERFLHYRGIWALGFIPIPDGVVLLRRPAGFSFLGNLEAFRDRIRATVTREAAAREGAIIKALILGEQRQIPREMMEAFSRTGTTHIIAISGFNVGIVALFAIALVRPLLRSSEWLLLRGNVTMLATSFALLVVCGYTFVAGGLLPVVRASLMIGAAMIALLCGRQRDIFNILALAAMLILLVDPTSLFSISFQLSFAAVAALILWVPPLVRLLAPTPPSPSPPHSILQWLYWQGKRAGRGIVVFLLVTLVATLGTLPLILYYFNYLSMITVAANLAAVPLLGILATPVCLLIIAAIPFSETLAGWLITIASPLVRTSLVLIETMASWSWSAIFVPTPSLGEIIAYYLLLAALFWWLALRFPAEDLPSDKDGKADYKLFLAKTVAALALGFFIINAGIRWDQSLHKGKLALTAIDVGQGSGTLVRFPGGQRMLVDGGGSYDEHFDVGRSIVAPYLWKEGIASIDTLVLTHPHPDHLQGLLFVASHFGVREVWTSGDSLDSPQYLAFQRLLRERGIKEMTLTSESPLQRVNGVNVAILNPPPNHPSPESNTGVIPRGDDLNERSLVLQIRFNEQAFLITGDISAVTEKRLLALPGDLKSDVLFLPHHGSRYSSDPLFLDRVRPQAAIVSCGVDNFFGFPHPQVVQRITERQIPLYRTDQDGAVTISTDGKSLTIQTFSAKER